MLCFPLTGSYAADPNDPRLWIFFRIDHHFSHNGVFISNRSLNANRQSACSVNIKEHSLLANGYNPRRVTFHADTHIQQFSVLSSIAPTETCFPNFDPKLSQSRNLCSTSDEACAACPSQSSPCCVSYLSNSYVLNEAQSINRKEKIFRMLFLSVSDRSLHKFLRKAGFCNSERLWFASAITVWFRGDANLIVSGSTVRTCFSYPRTLLIVSVEKHRQNNN